ncbi:unnamed protein product [Larinioides sclopetarius]|uniref:Uncharacterized protein n=1 Tax=Larinioides sclopetarius TaxID=280406 RepID=A0AAV2B217_9ARAC
MRLILHLLVLYITLQSFVGSSTSQDIVTPDYPTIPKLFLEEPGPHVADVLRTEEVSAEDDIKEIDYDKEDDEVNRIHLPIDPIVGESENYDKKHVPDHRFKLISLDNIVHLNPALQVSLWLFVACLVKAAGNCFCYGCTNSGVARWADVKNSLYPGKAEKLLHSNKAHFEISIVPDNSV